MGYTRQKKQYDIKHAGLRVKLVRHYSKCFTVCTVHRNRGGHLSQPQDPILKQRWRFTAE